MNAAVRPPAGVCTGDYSKFVELNANKPDLSESSSENPDRSRPRSQSGPSSSRTPPQDRLGAALLTGIITAEQLRRALAASPDGIVHLASTARLTPLAQDLAREQPGKIHDASAASAQPASAIRHCASAGGGDAPARWLWWADGHCPAVQTLTSRLREQLTPLSEPRTHSGLIQVVRELAQRVGDGQTVGGILFVENAALAMVYVNHCPSLRGVVAAHDRTVEQGIRELGANVLIVEYRHLNSQAITHRVMRFIAQPPNPPPTVIRELCELSSC